MFNSFRRRTRPGTTPRRRFFRPLLENLESRELLAFNLTISPTATNAAVTSSFDAGTNTRTYTSNATGANLSVNDIASELALHNVVVTSGGSPNSEAGSVSTSGITTFQFANFAGATLTIKNGSSGALASVAGITLTGLKLTKQGNLIIDANQNVNLSGDLNAGTMTITAGTGNIAMPTGGELGATVLHLTAEGDIGTSAQRILTNVSQLNTDSSANNADQFITQTGGLTALNLNAAKGDISLDVTAGGVLDADASNDITADLLSVVLGDPTPQDFGSAAKPIQTSVDELSVATFEGGGDQFITESNGLSSLQLSAGSGDATLTLVAGAIADTDIPADFFAAAATVTLSDPTAKDFGSVDNPIKTNVHSLTVRTERGGSQFIHETDGLTALDLDARTSQSGGSSGTISLIVSTAAVSDSDPDDDISGFAAAVSLNNSPAKDFGSATHPIGTSVSNLSVLTSAGGGSQFITASNNVVAGLNLNAGAGDITLTLTSGLLGDSDDTADITAATATVTLLGPSSSTFGNNTHPIGTDTNSLSVNTIAGNANQFITETNSTAVTSLDAGTGTIKLVGGTFNLIPNDVNVIDDSSALVVNSPAILNLANNSETIGGLAGSGTVAFKADSISQFLHVGGNNQDTTFSGNLSGNDTSNGFLFDRFFKEGTGTLTLSGNNDFTGFFSVVSGTLLVTGSLAASNGAVSVGNGTLGGTGIIDRQVNLNNGGHVAPGLSTGRLRTGNLSLNSGSIFDVEITGVAVDAFDEAIVTGAVSLGDQIGSPILNITAAGTVTLQSGNKIPLIDNNGNSDAVTGTFKDLPEGASLGSNFLGTGLTAKISYKGSSGNDNDVIIALSAGSLFPWHHDDEPLDVAGPGDDPQPDGSLAPGDSLAIINYINAFGPGAVPANAVIGLPFGFLDTAGGPNDTGDNFIAPNDALAIINAINSGQSAEGEATVGNALRGVPSVGRASLNPTPLDLLTLLALDVAQQTPNRKK